MRQIPALPSQIGHIWYSMSKKKTKTPIPSCLTTGAFVTKNDPEFPIRSVCMQRNCVNEYGKSTFTNVLNLKWKYRTGGYVYGPPAIADIDKDGENEIVFVSCDYRVYCLRSDGRLKWSYITGGDLWFVTTYDIDGDGKMEILTSSKDGYVYCLDCYGALKWKFYAGICAEYSPISVYDVDKDRNLEIICCARSVVYCLRPDGTVKWSASTGHINEGNACADIDNDGVCEVIVSSWDRFVYCFKGDGTLKWRCYAWWDAQSLSLYDVDNDGLLEVLCDSYPSRRLICIETDGTIKWYYTTGGSTWSIVFGAYDVDRDGIVECFEGSADRYMYCLRGTNGSLKWRFMTGGYVFCGGFSADLDGDGFMEVVFGSGDGRVYVLKHNGTLKAMYQTGGWTTYITCVSVDDADRDGKLEIYVPSHDYNIYCLVP